MNPSVKDSHSHNSHNNNIQGLEMAIISTFWPRFLDFEGVSFFHFVILGQTNYLSPGPGFPAWDPLARKDIVRALIVGEVDRNVE